MPQGLTIIFFISAGFILLLIELLTPGFGLPGVTGIAFIVIGCYIALKQSLLFGIIASLASILTVILFFKIFAKSFFWKKLRLDIKEEKEKGFISAEDLSYLIGKSATAVTVLRPSGIVLIEDKRVNATTDGRFIEKDKKVKVIRIEGNTAVVKEES